MTREDKIELLNTLLKIEEQNDVGNLTRAERREFQSWIEEKLAQLQEPTTAVVIPKGATNKDVFKAIFGYEPATDAVICNKEDWCGASEPCNYCISNPNNVGREEEWWNAQYKGGIENDGVKTT